jgi:hypothetical protein
VYLEIARECVDKTQWLAVSCLSGFPSLCLWP